MTTPPPAAQLDLEPRLGDPDAVFRKLIEAHRGLSAAASADLNVRIVLILANQLANDAMVCAAFDVAREQLNSEQREAAQKGGSR